MDLSEVWFVSICMNSTHSNSQLCQTQTPQRIILCVICEMKVPLYSYTCPCEKHTVGGTNIHLNSLFMSPLLLLTNANLLVLYLHGLSAALQTWRTQKLDV